MKKTYLAFDLGASSGRAILGTIDNGKLSLREVHRFPNGPVERDSSLFWDFNAICSEIRTGLGKALDIEKNLSGIAVDTWGVDYVILKKDGSYTRLPYHYRDSRTDSMPQKVFSVIPKEKLYARTGIQFMQLNTIYQLAAHKEKHPEDFADGNTFLFVPDAITNMLCGCRACEYTIASTSNLLDARKRNWDFELISMLGIPRSIFPEIKMPGTRAGTLSPDLMKAFNCGPIPVMFAGSHDTASAVASVPADDSKTWAYVSCGTWALLGAELSEPKLTLDAMSSDYTNEGGLAGSIRFLTNIMGSWLFQETKRVWNENGNPIGFGEMSKMAASAEPFKFFINPNDSRFFTPCNMPEVIRNFCADSGQGKIPSDAALLRCIYDSLALCFRYKIEKLEKLLGVKYNCLNMVGGATQDKLLMKLAADSTNIHVSAGPVEATSIGNICAQAMADSTLSSLSDARNLIHRSFDIEEFAPDFARRSEWDAAYVRFKAVTGLENS